MTPGSGALRHFTTAGLLLGILLLLLFRNAYTPEHTVFSNDGPLGAISSRAGDLPETFFGSWQDLNLLGYQNPSAPPSITQTLGMLTGKLIFSKIFAPFSLFFLGLSAWILCRQLRFAQSVCVLTALAAGLNSDFFSTACWGVATQPIAFGLNYLALAALADETSPRRWIRVVLAGFAVGMGVMEAFDLGAIFSLFTGAFVVYQPYASTGNLKRMLSLGLSRLVVVSITAGIIATAALVTLVSTQIKGIAGIDDPDTSSQAAWDKATQWSLPKREILDVMLPGIYGFRMDTPGGGKYWGAGGRDPSWDRYFESGKQGPPPQGAPRFSGGGHYAGALVLLVAAWAVAQSLRKRNSAFNDSQRRMVWFWLAVAIVGVLLAFGRFAPFYQFFYMLPGASTIRNPAKFIHVFEWAMVILFAYGMHGLSLAWTTSATTTGQAGPVPHFKIWWSKVRGFDRAWVRGMAIFLGLLVLGWLGYTQSKDALIRYMTEVAIDPSEAPAIASFSVRQPGWFILFYLCSAALVALVISGFFAGKRQVWAGVLLGTVLVVDLVRANVPWVVTYNWKERYALDPVTDSLRQDAHQHRVTVFPLDRFLRMETLGPEYGPLVQSYSHLRAFYSVEWLQHQFQYYNVQALDLVQMPRMPKDYENFLVALSPAPFRYWQLTNTRYLLAPAALLNTLNQAAGTAEPQFRTVMQFDVVPRPGLAEVAKYEDFTVVANTNGQYAVFAYAAALPRVALYSNWQVQTNDQQTLRLLPAPEFDPTKVVLVASPIAASPSTNAPGGTVSFAGYAPKHIQLKTKAATDTILLLNDKYDPNWEVRVDGKPAPLLRCNYIMRGVQVPAGEHTVEFRFAPSLVGLYVSVAAVVVGIGLLCFLGFSSNRRKDECAGERK